MKRKNFCTVLEAQNSSSFPSPDPHQIGLTYISILQLAAQNLCRLYRFIITIPPICSSYNLFVLVVLANVGIAPDILAMLSE
jgi:hypothetical protein